MTSQFISYEIYLVSYEKYAWNYDKKWMKIMWVSYKKLTNKSHTLS